jgi:hypothetical protein
MNLFILLFFYAQIFEKFRTWIKSSLMHNEHSRYILMTRFWLCCALLNLFISFSEIITLEEYRSWLKYQKFMQKSFFKITLFEPSQFPFRHAAKIVLFNEAVDVRLCEKIFKWEARYSLQKQNYCASKISINSHSIK